MSKFIRIECRITSDEKRCSFTIVENLASLDAFKRAIAGKMEIEIIEVKNDENGDEDEEEDQEENQDENRIKIELAEMVLSYTSIGDGKPIKIKNNQEFLDVIQFYLSRDEEFKIGRIIVDKVGGRKMDYQNDKQKQILQTQVIKMSMAAIPYKFSGKNDENINHFVYKLLNYCANNNIEESIIINLLLNGTLIKGDAFDYVELEKDEISKLDELDDIAKLNGILELLKNRYRCENLVIKIKKQLKELEQLNNELVKDYLIRADKLFDRLSLEINIASKAGQEYKRYDKFERTDIVMNGMHANIRNTVLDKAIDTFGTVRIEFKELKQILLKIEKKELYIKSLANPVKVSSINNINDYRYNSSANQDLYKNQSSYKYGSPTKQQLKDANQSLRNEINFIKLGNKRLYGRTPNDRSRTPPPRFTLKDKKENGPCPYKLQCKFGLRCKYLHEQSERDYFYMNNIGTGRGRGGIGGRGRGRGSFGGRGGRGNRRFQNNRNNQLVQINAIEQKENGNNNANINIASVELPQDF